MLVVRKFLFQISSICYYHINLTWFFIGGIAAHPFFGFSGEEICFILLTMAVDYSP
jgi:hypothetical protein